MNTIRNNSHPNDPARMTDEELKKISKRSMTYWFEDGLTEIVVGGLFLLIVIGTALLCSGGFTLRSYLNLPSPDHPTE